jgi:hypothetical protein
VIANISIGGHVGGLIGGVLAGLALNFADRRRSRALGYVLLAVLSVAAVAGAIFVSGTTGITGRG